MATVIKQTKQKVSVGKDVEKLELLCISGRNVKWCGHYEKLNGRSFKKLKIELSCDTAIPLLGIYPKVLKAGT